MDETSNSNVGSDYVSSTTSIGTTTTGATPYYTYQACIHKLPCGYCTLLNRACPMQITNQTEITWTTHPEVTCEAKV